MPLGRRTPPLAMGQSKRRAKSAENRKFKRRKELQIRRNLKHSANLRSGWVNATESLPFWQSDAVVNLATITRMTLGEQIIQELGRLGRCGMYFSFEGYNRLRRVKSTRELHDFLVGEGFQNPPQTTEVATIVDYIDKTTKKITFEDLVVLFALVVICKLEPGLANLPLFAFAGYLTFRRKPRRLFPMLRWPFTSPEPAIRV